MRLKWRPSVAITVLCIAAQPSAQAQVPRSRQHSEIFDAGGKKVGEIRTYLHWEGDWQGGTPFENREFEMFVPVVSLEWDDPKTPRTDHPEILLLVNRERFAGMGLRFATRDCSGTAYTEYEHALPGSLDALRWNYAVGPPPAQTLYAVKAGTPEVLTMHSEYDNWWGACQPPDGAPDGDTRPVVEMAAVTDLGDHFQPPFSLVRPRARRVVSE